ncbi:hypothetical protein AK830_g6654 [Neonectria ditissima]|uniref:uracil phosphoribosyltransferase n=1 Tax=Neonectria ditissima TaxID=78410 RepID=A0A0P7BBW1_9HYPO|nr:hypothetical protein AK830_g6654 [Neonectria ditissima]
MASLPPNVHVSKHPCVQAKLSQLRAKSASARDVKSLIHEISVILSCEALAAVTTAIDGPEDESPLGFQYTTTTLQPSTTCIVPILRSGLGMVEGVQTVLPNPVPVHHIGLYREAHGPVEYYNKLESLESKDSSLAILVDPVIATGGTCAAAISMLRIAKAKRIIVLSVIAAEEGLQQAAAEWPEATEFWIAGVDKELTASRMLKPGLGDIGNRLFLTVDSEEK